MIPKLFKFHGGVHPDAHKDVSAQTPIKPTPMPARLVVPLRQNNRSMARSLVQPGDKVLKGQRIGEAEGTLGTAVHAPTSGRIVDIADHPLAHPSGLTSPAVHIEPDGEERWVERCPLAPERIDRIEAIRHLRDCGVLGMGGAAFPTHVKLGPGIGIETLIINGAECEPWITCDDRLMRESAEAVLDGAGILAHLLGARRTLIGVEDNKPQAIAALQAALQQLKPALPTSIVAVPARYPAGGEKQLIKVLTGIEIPHGRLGGEFGVQCFNVGTACATHHAFRHGEPVLSRIVTLTGNAAQPGNHEVLIGTPLEHLIPLMMPKTDTDRYLMGGPMMGFAIPDLSVPVSKGSNCIIAASPSLFPPPKPELPCIRCGECARACPAELQPFELYWFSRSRNFGKAQEYHLFDCIECGCCSFVCPSRIPLVDYYRFAKSEIWARERENIAADQARDRFEFRNYRQEREKAEKAAKLAAKAAETKAKLAAKQSESGPTEPPEGVEDPKKALIAAALARAKAQKAAVKPANTEDLPPDAEAAISEIDARRQKALATAAADAKPTAQGNEDVKA